MKFFLDTADIAEIEEAASWGVLSGVTTNPTLYSRVGGKLAEFPAHIGRICEIVEGPVSAETVSLDREEIVREGLELAEIASNVVVKVPTMPEGLAATRELSRRGIKVNMTLCFTVPQALLAARSGASYVSPFIGRYDDISEDGIAQLADVVAALRNYEFGHQVEVIAASSGMRPPPVRRICPWGRSTARSFALSATWLRSPVKKERRRPSSRSASRKLSPNRLTISASLSSIASRRGAEQNRLGGIEASCPLA